MPFERPTDYYDDRIFSIDEQICALLKKRREASNNNPGFPPPENISDWAEKYDLYEDLLNSVFGALRMEEEFKPRVEPRNFIRHLPILKSVEKGDRLYTITYIRQFENASVVQLNIDWDDSNDDHDDLRHRHQHRFFELDLGEHYECRTDRSGGSGGHYRYNFIVSPPIPDDHSGIELVFKEYHDPFKGKPTGIEMVFHVD